MVRLARTLVTVAVVAAVVAVPATSVALTAPADAVSAAAVQENGTEPTPNGTEPTPNGTDEADDERNLTGDNETSIVDSNESAAAEAGLANATDDGDEAGANETAPSMQAYNGTYRTDGATGVYDHVLVTSRNGTLQIFARNTTVATEAGTVTLHNTFVAIGDDLSARELGATYEELAGAFANDTDARANVSAVTTNETVNATENETAEVDVGNATATAGPQLDDLALSPLGDALAAELPDAVLERQVRVKADLANVRTNDTATTYRDVFLRGTFAELLEGEANATRPTPERANATEATFEREYFEVSDLEAPDSLTADGTYRINATVTNPGGDDGAEEVSLRIAGERLAQELVRLEPGASTNVSFQADLGDADLGPGTYELGIYAFADGETAVVTLGEGTRTAN